MATFDDTISHYATNINVTSPLIYEIPYQFIMAYIQLLYESIFVCEDKGITPNMTLDQLT